MRLVAGCQETGQLAAFAVAMNHLSIQLRPYHDSSRIASNAPSPFIELHILFSLSARAGLETSSTQSKQAVAASSTLPEDPYKRFLQNLSTPKQNSPTTHTVPFRDQAHHSQL